MQFKNKVVVITGGAHGIGKTTKEAFEAEGALVEVIDIAEGTHFVGDISKKEVLEEFASYVLERHGHVDYLINNALPVMRGINECSYEEFEYAMAVGVTALVQLLQKKEQAEACTLIRLIKVRPLLRRTHSQLLLTRCLSQIFFRSQCTEWYSY